MADRTSHSSCCAQGGSAQHQFEYATPLADVFAAFSLPQMFRRNQQDLCRVSHATATCPCFPAGRWVGTTSHDLHPVSRTHSVRHMGWHSCSYLRQTHLARMLVSSGLGQNAVFFFSFFSSFHASASDAHTPPTPLLCRCVPWATRSTTTPTSGTSSSWSSCPTTTSAWQRSSSRGAS